MKSKKQRNVIDIEYVVGSDDTALIVLARTGVHYTAQCGGVGCTHPQAEGYVLNVFGFAQDFDTCQYGCADLDDPGSGANRQGLATDFDTYASAHTKNWSWKISFDWPRIDETQEGWIPVLLNGRLDAFDGGEFNDTPGFIHNGNCD